MSMIHFLLTRPWLCLLLAMLTAYLSYKAGEGAERLEQQGYGFIEIDPPPPGQLPLSQFGLPAMDADLALQDPKCLAALREAESRRTRSAVGFWLAATLVVVALLGRRIDRLI